MRLQLQCCFNGLFFQLAWSLKNENGTDCIFRYSVSNVMFDIVKVPQFASE